MNQVFLLLTGVVAVIVVWAGFQYRAFKRKVEDHRKEEAAYKESVRDFAARIAAKRADELKHGKSRSSRQPSRRERRSLASSG